MAILQCLHFTVLVFCIGWMVCIQEEDVYLKLGLFVSCFKHVQHTESNTDICVMLLFPSA